MTLPASLAAQHNLVAHDGKHGQWRNWANGVNEPFQSKPGEHIDNVVLTLTRGATVKGKAVNADGTPAVGKRVQATTNDGKDNRYYVPETRTDEEGNFELKFVRAGEVRVQVEPFWLQSNGGPGSSTQSIALEAGESKEGVELQYAPAPNK
jgi:hypothetical protein